MRATRPAHLGASARPPLPRPDDGLAVRSAPAWGAGVARSPSEAAARPAAPHDSQPAVVAPASGGGADHGVRTDAGDCRRRVAGDVPQDDARPSLPPRAEARAGGYEGPHGRLRSAYCVLAALGCASRFAAGTPSAGRTPALELGLRRLPRCCRPCALNRHAARWRVAAGLPELPSGSRIEAVIASLPPWLPRLGIPCRPVTTTSAIPMWCMRICPPTGLKGMLLRILYDFPKGHIGRERSPGRSRAPSIGRSHHTSATSAPLPLYACKSGANEK